MNRMRCGSCSQQKTREAEVARVAAKLQQGDDPKTTATAAARGFTFAPPLNFEQMPRTCWRVVRGLVELDSETKCKKCNVEIHAKTMKKKE